MKSELFITSTINDIGNLIITLNKSKIQVIGFVGSGFVDTNEYVRIKEERLYEWKKLHWFKRYIYYNNNPVIYINR